MLEVCKNKNYDSKNVKNLPKINDVIVQRTKYEWQEDEQGNQVRKKTTKKVNLTKLTNETKKLIKQDQATILMAKIDEVKDALTFKK